MPDFPQLPIITPGPAPRATQAEKYGALFYLGIAGLVVTLGLVGAFGYGLWATRDLWRAVLTLNNPKRAEADRIDAAWTIAHHPASNDRLRIDHAFRTSLPGLARYIAAEGLTPEAIRADPKGYASMVARSSDWPGWLRLILVRPMALAVGEGYRIPWEPLDELRANPDPAVALWALYTRAVMPPGVASCARELRDRADQPGPMQPLARLLADAAGVEGEARLAKLAEATAWLREHHPAVEPLWRGRAAPGGLPGRGGG